MKKITLLFLLLTISFTGFSQCLVATNGQYPSTTYVPTCDGITAGAIDTFCYASEYSVVTVTSGVSYTFSSSIATDVVTISADGGSTSAATGIGSVTWVATLSGDVNFYTNLNDGACGAQSTPRTRLVLCGTPAVCNPVTDFSENFDAAIAFPTCWYKLGTTGSAAIQANANNTSTPNVLYIYSSSTTNLAVVSMPPVSNAGDGTHRLKFRARGNFTAGGNLEVGYLTSPTDPSTFIGVQTFTTTSITTYDSFTALLGTAPGTNQVLAFRHTGSPANSILIDDVIWEAIPSCVEPTGLSSSSVTTNSATISWTASTSTPANGYEYYFSTSNIAPTSSTTPSGNVATGFLTADLSGLNSGTQYYFWVRSVCSSTNSSPWSSSGTFTTACVAVTDFSENFDASLALPACWAKVGSLGLANIQANANNTSSPNVLYILSGSTTSLAVVSMPPVSNAGDATHRLRFNARGNFTAGGVLEVGYLTDPADATTFVGVQSFTTSSNTTFDTFNAYLGTAPGSNQYLAFRHTGSPANSIMIDDVNWEVAPSCIEPNTLVVSNLTTNSATVSWTASSSNPANGYDYYISTTNTAPTTPTGSVAAGVVTYDFTGLTQGTTYYYWVRSNCSSTDSSSWVSGSFTTLFPAPANDECAGALPLTPGGVFTDNPLSGSVLGCVSDTTNVPSCVSGSNPYNVWYTVQVPASGSITIETQADTTNSITDTILAVYSGTCGSLTELGCNDDTTGLFSTVSLTGQTAGDTLYVSVWKYGSTPGSPTVNQFLVSAYDASLGTNTFLSTDFSIYPNPVKDNLNISYNDTISNVEVVNLLGQKVINLINNSTQAQVDMSNLPYGVYMVKVTSNNKVKTIKVIKE
jgi:hypothetical protein